ncbi:MAG: hypothetical protein JWQ78_698 [Sediminibacterium sp.]|nr:hypothetical protein [Sediminibacterium sp.]
MKMIELNKLGLQPLQEADAQNIEGGFWFLPPAVGLALLMSAIQNFGDIRQGVYDGWRGKSRYKS